MDEVAILQRKVISLSDDDEWENVAFTIVLGEIHEWIKGAHMYEKRKIQWVKRQS